MLGLGQLNKQDLEWLGLERLDISPSAAMATATTFTGDIENDPATTAAAWRLLEAGDTLSISQVEGVAVRMLLRRAHELAELQSQGGRALESIEDLAQLLALWKPGAYNEDREQAFFDARSLLANGQPMHIRTWPQCWIARSARCSTPTS
jgi:DNA polymerase III alpha subunit